MPSTIANQHSNSIEGFFESKVLTIAVGPEETLLNVYESALKRTAFFEIEGLPSTQDEKNLQRIRRQQSMDLRNEPNSAISNVPKIEDNQNVMRDCTVIADYYLYQQEKRILRTEAFKVFLLFLYNTPPMLPRSRSDCKSMLQVYCLAIRYKCDYIQNEIIDRLRKYHSHTCVKFDDLTWMVSRLGDNTAYPMVAYLVDQIAYEIAKDGFSTFKDSNPFLEIFLTVGDRYIRIALFEALARHAQHTKISDPANTGKDWHTKTSITQ